MMKKFLHDIIAQAEREMVIRERETFLGDPWVAKEYGYYEGARELARELLRRYCPPEDAPDEGDCIGCRPEDAPDGGWGCIGCTGEGRAGEWACINCDVKDR